MSYDPRTASVAEAAERLVNAGEVDVRSKAFAENMLRLFGNNPGGYRWTPRSDHAGWWIIEEL